MLHLYQARSAFSGYTVQHNCPHFSAVSWITAERQTCDFALKIYEYAELNGQQSATIAKVQQHGCQQSALEKSFRAAMPCLQRQYCLLRTVSTCRAHWEHNIYDVQYGLQDTKTLTEFLFIPEGLASALSMGSIRHQMEGHCAISQVGRL